MDSADFIIILLAVFLPPVAVVLDRGCGPQLLINILLTICGHIPGAIHAVYLVLHNRKERVRAQQAQYTRQTDTQPTYGAPAQPGYGDNKIQDQSQPMYFDQSRAPVPEPTPPTYPDETATRGEKQEYTPLLKEGLGTKEV